MGKGRGGLVLGLSAIAVGGALAWGIGYYRQSQAHRHSQQLAEARRDELYRRSQQLANATKEDFRGCVLSLAALGPSVDPYLQQFLVVPSDLYYEEHTVWHAHWGKGVRMIHNDRPHCVYLIRPFSNEDALLMHQHPSRWVNDNPERVTLFGDVLGPGEAVVIDGIPDREPARGPDEIRATEVNRPTCAAERRDDPAGGSPASAGEAGK